MSHFAFQNVVQQCIARRTSKIFQSSDWLEWRYCYNGGSIFREKFLEQFDGGREDLKDFKRRQSLTPIPAYAKNEINKVINSISNRLGDVSRRDGSEEWQDAVGGVGRGVDLRGSSMNAYITKQLLSEALVMQQVGVLVDAPKTQLTAGQEVVSQADVVDFQPYLNRYKIEDIALMIEAKPDSPSDWAHVLLEDHTEDFDLLSGKNECTNSFRYYWLDPLRGNLVNVAFLNNAGDLASDIIFTDLTQIPFVLFDILRSLMADVCAHQIALLNLISADTTYAVDANFSFLTRQRGNDNSGTHLIGGSGDDRVRPGSRKGLFYNKNEERPGFISPPTGPMKASLELRRELKDEVRELVTGAIADLGERGSVEAGLSFIGNCFQMGEERLWDFWVIFEENQEDKRKVPTTSYPDSWSLKTRAERIEEAKDVLALSAQLVGQPGKQETHRLVYDIMYRGEVSADALAKMKKAVDDSPIAASDPKTIIAAKEKGILCVETAALALGANPGEGEKAKEDAAIRAAQITAAQADAAEGAARGAEDLSVDPESNKLAREGEAEGGADLSADNRPGQRGEGSNNNGS